MIKKAIMYIVGNPPVFIDGFIYVGIAIFQFLTAAFGDDESAKYIAPITLYWLKRFVGVFAAAFLATKLYRSTAFADYKKEKKENTNVWKKQGEEIIPAKTI